MASGYCRMTHSAGHETEVLARETCDAEGWCFEDVFRYQYRISDRHQQHSLLSKTWCIQELDGLIIEHCPDLPVTRLEQKDGSLSGFILGVAIGQDGRCLGRVERQGEVAAESETWIETLAGRFVVLLRSESEIRFYCDPAGNLSAVAHAAARVVASSVALAVQGPLIRDEDIDTGMLMQRKERLMFGETSDVRVRRLQPNHYLTLGDFTAHRHWPKPDTPFAALDKDRKACIAGIAEKLSRNISALTERFRCGLPVTGGMDSRLLLASADGCLEQIAHFFCYRLNRATFVDAEAAIRLAEKLALPMQIISRRSHYVQTALPEEFEEEEHRRMLLRTGWCYAVRRDWARFVALTPMAEVILRGTGLEMTRANKWRADTINVPCNPVDGLRALTTLRPGKKRNQAETLRYNKLLADYTAWSETLPETARDRMYDIAHIELMLPAGPVLEYSAYTRHFTVNPFNDRQLYQLTAAIAPRARMRFAVVRKVIAHGNRSLLEVPFYRELAEEMNGTAGQKKI